VCNIGGLVVAVDAATKLYVNTAVLEKWKNLETQSGTDWNIDVRNRIKKLDDKAVDRYRMLEIMISLKMEALNIDTYESNNTNVASDHK
jgi:hypothetical protein